jgi:hypothetical protein
MDATLWCILRLASSIAPLFAMICMYRLAVKTREYIDLRCGNNETTTSSLASEFRHLSAKVASLSSLERQVDSLKSMVFKANESKGKQEEANKQKQAPKK